MSDIRCRRLAPAAHCLLLFVVLKIRPDRLALLGSLTSQLAAVTIVLVLFLIFFIKLVVVIINFVVVEFVVIIIELFVVQLFLDVLETQAIKLGQPLAGAGKPLGIHLARASEPVPGLVLPVALKQSLRVGVAQTRSP